MMDDSLFILFNKQRTTSNDFDELYDVRAEIVELFSVIFCATGPLKMYQYFTG